MRAHAPLRLVVPAGRDPRGPAALAVGLAVALALWLLLARDVDRAASARAAAADSLGRAGVAALLAAKREGARADSLAEAAAVAQEEAAKARSAAGRLRARVRLPAPSTGHGEPVATAAQVDGTTVALPTTVVRLIAAQDSALDATAAALDTTRRALDAARLALARATAAGDQLAHANAGLRAALAHASRPRPGWKSGLAAGAALTAAGVLAVRALR